MSYHRFSIIQGRAVVDKRVSNAQLRTLCALGMYADPDGWCFPSQSTVGDDLGKSRQTVNEDIATLTELGYLQKVEIPTGRGKEFRIKYRLLHDTLPMGGVGIPGQGVSDFPDSNDPSNDPSNTASGDFTPCRHCGEPIFYDTRDTVYLHSRRTGKDDNGYYCAGQKYLGLHAEPRPVTHLPIEWQIAAGAKTVTVPDNRDAEMKDVANIIATSMGSKAERAYQLAYAFMTTRGIIIPYGQVKGQRKVIKEMIEMGVMPEHVVEATQMLIDKKMTVTDLHSVRKTALALANPAPDEYTGAIEGI